MPTRYKAIAGKEWIKISTGTADRQEAMRRWPDILAKYNEIEAEWERRLNVVPLTPDKAEEIAAKWAAWIAADLSRLPRDDRGLFATDLEARLVATVATVGTNNPLDPNAIQDGLEVRRVARVDQHITEALRLAEVDVAPNSRPLLVRTMLPVVAAAYRQAGLVTMGATGGSVRWNPLGAVREALPAVPDAPPTKRDAKPKVTLTALFEGWKATATVKPRTITETHYILKLLIAHLGHEDATKITRTDIASWRDAGKADGVTNNTWNNRLSMVRQVLDWGASEGHLQSNPAETTLRLKKSKAAVRLPYSDEETALILNAARKETRAALRWAPRIMAFTGMRAGEVLQLSVADVRQDSGIWFFAVHEDDADKSVKSGQRRNVPVHPALIDEGLLDYVRSLPQDGPVFPDKALGQHGTRGERAWNVTGQWIREVVGITDTQKAPNHSFRHRMEDELRAAEVPEDARDAILGHTRKTTGRMYGVRKEALSRLHRHLSLVPMPPGVPPGVHPPASQDAPAASPADGAKSTGG